MGIEQKPDDVWVPDGQTKWPEMKDPERSQVYQSHKEKYAGTMAKYKNEREKARDDYWMTVNEEFNYANEYAAIDPKLKGMPVSMALLLAFGREFSKPLAKSKGLFGKAKSMMLYSLNYMQNAKENVALRKSKYPNGNIDTVPSDGFVKISSVGVGTIPRWQLQILDKNRNVLFAAFVLPNY